MSSVTICRSTATCTGTCTYVFGFSYWPLYQNTDELVCSVYSTPTRAPAPSVTVSKCTAASTRRGFSIRYAFTSSTVAKPRTWEAGTSGSLFCITPSTMASTA